MSQPYLGEIRMFGGNFAPRNWSLCNGQLLSISQNTALFSILGTYYGGNGTQTFALPDFRGRVPMNWGQANGGSNYTIGEAAGTENVTLLQTQMPAHNHLINASGSNGDQNSPVGSIQAITNDGSGRTATVYPSYTQTAATGTMAPTSLTIAGGNQPHSNLQPFLAVSFIIALSGIFPSRN